MHFITDIKNGEVDILSDIMQNDLIFRDLDDRAIATIPAPPTGWSHEALTQEGNALSEKLKQGANAYLGQSWVGGTEV